MDYEFSPSRPAPMRNAEPSQRVVEALRQIMPKIDDLKHREATMEVPHDPVTTQPKPRQRMSLPRFDQDDKADGYDWKAWF